MKTVCVYCGSSSGRGDVGIRAAEALGLELAGEGIGLVYGGASKGLMGILADAVLAAGGTVQGVIPRALVDREIAHPGLHELHVVHSMHERKALMAELADGFIALPGGFGTLEEIVEMLTWGQLGIHEKPCGLLNAGGYYDRLLDFLDHARDSGFVKPVHRDMLLVESEPARLLERFRAYAPARSGKWL